MEPSLIDSITFKRPSYNISPNGSTTATFESGEIAVHRGRGRWYPGLIDAAPDTTPFYRFAANVLAGTTRGIDFGCGTGTGTAILRQHWSHVTGWDPDRDAISFARALWPDGTFDHGGIPQESGLDGAVVIDVMGLVPWPYGVLRTLWRSLTPGAAVMVAEPRAHSSQQLVSPARQAFSRHELAALLSAAGFDVIRWASAPAGFNTCLAVKRPTYHEQFLEDAMRAIGAFDLDRARHLLAAANDSQSAEVRVEVRLREADVALASGDGDEAVRCFMQASALDPQDPRPVSGIARLLAIAGDSDEARRLAGGAVKLDPTNATANAVLALLVEDDAPGYARTCWQAASSLAPSDPWIVSEFACRFADAGSVDAAISAVERLWAYGDEMGAEYHLAFAGILERAGRTEDARLEAKIAFAQEPANPEILGTLRRLGGPSLAASV